MTIVALILLILLVIGFVGLFRPKIGRTLFDVAVFIILLFLLIGTTGVISKI